MWKNRCHVIVSRDDVRKTVEEVKILTHGDTGLAEKSESIKWRYMSLMPLQPGEDFVNQSPENDVLRVGGTVDGKQLTRQTMIVR